MTNGKPLVSIGVPVYNGEKYIRQALDSIVGQTYENLEVVISDNASTDATGAICREYAARDSRIHYHRNVVTIDVHANFRHVFELSAGDYFMWAAADDLKPPTAVAKCLETLLRNDRAVLAHGVVLVRLEEREDLVEITNEMDLSDPRAAGRVRAFTKGVRHNAMSYGLYRRAALARGRMTDYYYGPDYLLCLQMCLLGPVEYVRTPMIIYRTRHPVLSDNVMYPEVPITMGNLLRIGGLRRRKCWTVLLIGCYYLYRIRGVNLTQRLGAIAAHMMTFSRLYRSRLAKEVVFQLFAPVAWLSGFIWRLASRWSFSFRLARKVQSVLMRA